MNPKDQPNPELKPDMLRVEVANGKYTVVQDSTGKLFALRHGEPWRDCVGDNLILYLAYELQELRNTRATPPVHKWTAEELFALFVSTL